MLGSNARWGQPDIKNGELKMSEIFDTAGTPDETPNTTDELLPVNLADFTLLNSIFVEEIHHRQNIHKTAEVNRLVGRITKQLDNNFYYFQVMNKELNEELYGFVLSLVEIQKRHFMFFQEEKAYKNHIRFLYDIMQ